MDKNRGVVQKVTAFVVSSRFPRRLLLFEHPLAGVQLPAGTVEPDENIVDAARREILEETGVRVVTPGRVLGSEVESLEEHQVVMTRDVHAVQFEADDDIGTRFRRGHKAWVVDVRSEGYLRLREEIYDYDVAPPVVASFFEGWVNAGAVADSIERTFVMFEYSGDAQGSWVHRADGYMFRIFWADYPPQVRLVEGQQEWLDDYQEHLGSKT